MKLKVWAVSCAILVLFISPAFAAGKKGKEFTFESFRYAPYSISKTTVSGIPLSDGVSFSVISQIGGIMAGNPSSVPLDFIINMQVQNPNEKTASLHEYDYILRVDNIELARGTVKKAFKIGGKKTKAMPLPIHMDLASLLRGNSLDTVQNMIKNFMGTGSRRTNVILQIKPTYKVGKDLFPATRYIPVSFSFERRGN